MSRESIVGASTVIRGNISGAGSLEIQGRVEGDVTMSGAISVLPGAVVRGNVQGAQLSVSGAVAGDLSASDYLVLERGARVLGDLVAASISIGEGALVRGYVRTAGEPALEQRKAPAAVAARPGTSTLAMKAPAARAPMARPEPARSLGRVAPAKPAEKPSPEPAHAAAESEAIPPAASAARAGGAPAPVVPALKKSVKAKKKVRGS